MLQTMIANLAQCLADAVRLAAQHEAFGAEPQAIPLGYRVFARDSAQLGIVMSVVPDGTYVVLLPPCRYRPELGNWQQTYRARDLRSAEFTIG